MSIRYNWSGVEFKSRISLLVFCLSGLTLSMRFALVEVIILTGDKEVA